ncbi:Ras-related protein Rab-32 [Blattella germanica]|nr:Ras-related protein Rab-32 [Blattella germanica]
MAAEANTRFDTNKSEDSTDKLNRIETQDEEEIEEEKPALRILKMCKAIGGKEFTFKVLLVGDSSTGKTSFVKSYINGGAFNSGYKSTIGVDFYYKDIRLDRSIKVRLQLWDFSGAHGVLVLADFTRKETFDGAVDWKNEVDIKMLFSSSHGFVSWMHASAKNCINIEEAGQLLLYKMLKKMNSLVHKSQHNNENITLEAPREKTKKCC